MQELCLMRFITHNVFNSIQNKFFQIINVIPTKPPGCASNCSGNGICIDNNYCQCNNKLNYLNNKFSPLKYNNQ